MKQPNAFLLLIPMLIFAGFIALAMVGLKEDKQGQPIVAATGKQVPDMKLPVLNGKQFLTQENLKGQKTLVNFFASWCVPCIAEHEFMSAINDALPLPIIGIVYKDKDAAVKKFLKQNGNPFKTIALDREGRTAIDWGVTGVPETFLIDADGKILAHASGPLSIPVWEKYFKPFLKDLPEKKSYEPPAEPLGEKP